MKPSKTAAPGRLLTQVAGERRTGALVVGGHPGGTVYLIEGHVTYAESPAAPGVGELLTASGRLAGRTWQAALDAGTAHGAGRAAAGRAGPSHPGRAGAVRARRASTTPRTSRSPPPSAPVDFLDGAMHWLGPVIRVDAAAVNRGGAPPGPAARRDLPGCAGRHGPGDPGAAAAGRAGHAHRAAVGAAGARRRPAHAGRSGPAARPGRLRDHPGAAPAGGAGPARAARGTRPHPDRPTSSGCRRARGTAGGRRTGRWCKLDEGPTVPVVAGTPAARPRRRPVTGSRTPRAGRRRHPPAPPPTRTARSTGRRGWPAANPARSCPRSWPADAPPVHPGTDEVLLKRIRTALRALR